MYAFERSSSCRKRRRDISKNETTDHKKDNTEIPKQHFRIPQPLTSSICFLSKPHGTTGATIASEIFAQSEVVAPLAEFPAKLGKGKVGREGKDSILAPWATGERSDE